MTRTIYIALALCFSAAAAHAERQEFDRPFEDVWFAAIDAVSDLQYTTRDQRREDGIIYLAAHVESGYNVSGLVGQYTSKSVGRFSTWQYLALLESSSITVRKTARGAAVEPKFIFQGFNQFSGMWRVLPSSGYLEKKLLYQVGQRLAASREEPPDVPVEIQASMTARDQERDERRASLVKQFRVIGASIENGVPAERIAEMMAESQVALEEEEARGRTDFTDRLRNALYLYRERKTAEAREILAGAVDPERHPRPRRPIGPGPIVQ